MMIYFTDWLNRRAMEKRKREMAAYRKKLWGETEQRLNAQWHSDRRRNKPSQLGLSVDI